MLHVIILDGVNVVKKCDFYLRNGLQITILFLCAYQSDTVLLFLLTYLVMIDLCYIAHIAINSSFLPMSVNCFIFLCCFFYFHIHRIDSFLFYLSS